MAEQLCRRLYGADRPTVGVLNVGAEEQKGTTLVKETAELFRESELEFVYRPMSVILGGVLTATGFLSCGVLGFVGWRRGELLQFTEQGRLRSKEVAVEEPPLEARAAAASREGA
jgi:hypothetical protein